MQSVTQPDVPHSIHSTGVDWITATANHGSTRWDMQTFADTQRQRFMDADVAIKPAYRLGYAGWEAPGFFNGNREGGSIVVASGSQAQEVFRSVVHVADNISRLDLQVTVATPIERPHLGIQAYQVLKGGSPSRVQVKNVTLITSQPEGETCSIGKRSSDNYGRIYDKATESGQAPPRSLWRYEVEYKRGVAKRIALDLAGYEAAQAVAGSLVHSWFSARGVTPIYAPEQLFCSQNPSKDRPSKSVLSWFEDSLSITIARAVRRYGLVRVLEALRLSNLVVPIEKGD